MRRYRVLAVLVVLALVALPVWRASQQRLTIADINLNGDPKTQPINAATLEHGLQSALATWQQKGAPIDLTTSIAGATPMALDAVGNLGPLRDAFADRAIDLARKPVDITVPGQSLGVLALADRLAEWLPWHRESFEIALDVSTESTGTATLHVTLRSSKNRQLHFQLAGTVQDVQSPASALYRDLAAGILLLADPDATLPALVSAHMGECACFDDALQATALTALPQLSDDALALLALALVYPGWSGNWSLPLPDLARQTLVSQQTRHRIELRLVAAPATASLHTARLLLNLALVDGRTSPPSHFAQDFPAACGLLASELAKLLGPIDCGNLRSAFDAWLYLLGPHKDTISSLRLLLAEPRPASIHRVLAVFAKAHACQTPGASSCEFKAGDLGLLGPALDHANAAVRQLGRPLLVGPSIEDAADFHLLFGDSSDDACKRLLFSPDCPSAMRPAIALAERQAGRRLALAEPAYAEALCQRAARTLPPTLDVYDCLADAQSGQARLGDALAPALAAVAARQASGPLPVSQGQTPSATGPAWLAAARLWRLTGRHLEAAQALSLAEQDPATPEDDRLAEALAQAVRRCDGATRERLLAHWQARALNRLSRPELEALALAELQRGRIEHVGALLQALKAQPGDAYMPALLDGMAAARQGDTVAAQQALDQARRSAPQAYDAPRELYWLKMRERLDALGSDSALRQRLGLSGATTGMRLEGAYRSVRGVHSDATDLAYFWQCPAAQAPATRPVPAQPVPTSRAKPTAG
ncbi:MAG: hypothetical protein CFE45_04905 [Burkholderiales bacterium PBB5]|nr:MAG: hypothetical protein CFE45_04905 [Burkholderiales bacterium PBB5]